MGGGNLAFSGDIPYNTVKSSLPVSDCGRRKMGEIDLVLNRYFEDGERYADLINGYAFNGDQVVRKEDVQELDPRETGVTGRLGRRPGIQKYRDSIRRVVLGARFVLIGLEHQDQVHYAMPVRVMLQDAAEYDRQLRRIRRANRRVGGTYGRGVPGRIYAQGPRLPGDYAGLILWENALGRGDGFARSDGLRRLP